MSLPVQAKDEVVEALSANVAMLREFGVEKLGLFGSFPRDALDETGALDVLVGFRPGEKTYDNFIDLALFLEELLGKRVELVTVESLNPHGASRILDETEYVVAA